jgi:outer membrane protein with beta-barrel domain
MMRLFTIGHLIVVTLVMASSSAFAQTFTKRRIDVAVAAGFSKTFDDEGSVGTGGNLDGSIGVRLTPRIGVEAGVGHVRHDRIAAAGALRFEGGSTLLSASAIFRFSDGRAQPYVRAGYGVIHYAGTLTSGPQTDLPPGVHVPDAPTVQVSRRGNASFVAAAAGLDVYVTPQVSIRPAFTMNITQTNRDWMPWVIFGGGVGAAFHW